MPKARVVQILSVVFILVGLLGLVTTPPTMAGGMLIGLFPVNILHNLVHLLLGVWGLVAARSESGAVGYARIAGVLYLVLAGLAVVTPRTFGLIPIGGHDIWLHTVLGIVLCFVGFTKAKAPATA
jgi:hypothetical protein